MYPVDVLKFIDQNIPVLVLPRRQNVLSLGKQLIAEYQHIVKIQKPFVHHGLLIALVQLLKQLLRTVFGIIVVQIHHLALYQADLGEDLGRKFCLVLHIHAEFIYQLPDDPGALLFPGNVRCVIAVGTL